MRVEGYSMDLYCDNDEGHDYRHGYNPRVFPDVYFGPDRATCRRDARKMGWVLGRERDLCPECSGKRRGWLEQRRKGELIC